MLSCFSLRSTLRLVLYLILSMTAAVMIGCSGGGGGGDGETGDGGTTVTQYTLTVQTSGQGSVVTMPPGNTFDAGTILILMAQPSSGWEFSAWSGDVSGTTANQQLTMDADKTITATFTETVIQDSEAPTWPSGAGAASADIGATFLTLAWDEAQDNVEVTTYRIFKDQVLQGTVPGNKTDFAVTGLSIDAAYTFRVEAGDAAGNWSATGLSHAAATADSLPPDPSGTAPDLNATTTTSMSDACAFLYTGPDAIQKGVVQGTIEDHRIAVLRGVVKDGSGLPLPGVTVSVLGMPDLGRTTTRSDGAYDMAVNGGGLVKVRFEKENFLPIKRQVSVPWENYVQIDDVIMIPRDATAHSIPLNSAVDAKVATDNLENDADGLRQARLVVPKGVSGELVLADGTRQSLDNMNLRITEYTVGPDGPQRMPAEMPPNIAYTYAMDLSIDEAMNVNADDVVFDTPLYFYLDNFLEFPAGIKVPTGYYDDERGVWVPSESGLVIKILTVDGNTVTIDTDGDGQPGGAATLAGLGFTDEEISKLAELYDAGDTLWRVPIDHFSSWDCNFGAWPPADAEIPWFKPDPNRRPDPCKSGGSIIDTANMALGEVVDLAGLPFDLYYQSDRMPGFTHTRELTLRDETAPDSLQGILLEIEVAGQFHEFEFEKDPGPLVDVDKFSFTWDGMDIYGREVQGSMPMTVRVGYVYDGEYEANDRWGEAIADDMTATEITVGTRQQIGLWNEWTVYIGGIDPRGVGLGGWSLGIHHFYDPASKTLYRGDGKQTSSGELDPIVTTVAGTGDMPLSFLWSHDGEKATQVDLGPITDTAMGPNGSLYIAEYARGILRVMPDGSIYQVAGGGLDDASDGIEATEALVQPLSLAIGLDESIYISESDRIRKVSPEGRISTIAGEGDAVYGPDGGPAMGAAFEAYKIAVAEDGNVYILDNDACIIRRIGNDGVLRTFAGTQDVCGAYSGEGGRARSATFGLPMSMALAPDGSVYVADMLAGRVLRIAPNGVITTAAGTGDMGNEGDGGPANAASLLLPSSVDVGPDNSLYIGTAGSVRKVGPDGIISTIAGGADAIESQDDVPARQAGFTTVNRILMGPDKNLYLTEQGKFWVRKIGTSLGDLNNENEISVVDNEFEQMYIFDTSGLHLRTVDIWSGAVLWEFDYDPVTKYLWKIIDVDGDETIITRDVDGNSTIQPSQASPTTLELNQDGYLTRIIDPENNTHQFSYDGENGLLTTLTMPNNDPPYTFEYYEDGRLKKDSNPVGGSQTLTRSLLSQEDGFKVSVTTEMGRETTYETVYLDEGGIQAIKTYPHGLSKTLLWTPDAGQTVQYVDDTEITLEQGPDPRFGMQIPLPKRLTETTPGGLTRETRMTRGAQLGTIIDTISINDQTYTMTFEELGKRFTLLTPENRQMIFTLNTQGRIDTLQSNSLAPITFEYNELGKVINITVANGTEERNYHYTYDVDDGFLASATTPLTGTVTFENDLAGRIIRKTLDDDRQIDFDYDNNGNVASISPPGKSPHTFGYTALNRPKEYNPPDAGFSPDSMTIDYNPDGQVSAVHRPGGSNLVFMYDDAGRMLSYSHDTYGVTIGYDGENGHLATLTTAPGIVHTLTWDGFLMTGDAWVMPGAISGSPSGDVSGSVEGFYNNDFMITRLKICGGPLRNITYDRDVMMDSAGGMSMARDENGLVTATAIGIVTTTATYNDFGEPVLFRAYKDATQLMEISYVYDKGRITDITEVFGTDPADHYLYTYDSTGRLTAVTKNGSPVTGYTYDDNSNRSTYTGAPANVIDTEYDAQDRLLKYGDATFAYTDAGALQSRTVGSQNPTTYHYDFTSNLRAVILPDGTQIEYLIDGMNRSIGKKIGGVLVQGFVYLDQTRPVAELNADGAVKSEFIYGTRANVPDIMFKDGSTYRFLSDHLGSPRLVVNTATGEIAQRIDYDPFGNPTFVFGSPDFQPFGFAGGLYDSDTGLVRFGARDFDPETGRWTCKDPIFFSGGDTNLYGYVLADPVNFIDPSGYVAFPLTPNQFRQAIGPEGLDWLPSSQAAADISGGIGDALIDSASMGMVTGKQLRQMADVDIVNECSDKYKISNAATSVVTSVSSIKSAKNLPQNIKKLRDIGAKEFLKNADNAYSLSSGAVSSANKMADWAGK